MTTEHTGYADGKTFVIFDLDNCLADDGWRIQYIDWSQANPDDRYREYHRRAGYDLPRNQAMVKGLEKDCIPIFLTARPVEIRAQTVAWIERHLTKSHYVLIMRNIGDHRHSRDLKQGQLRWLLEDYGLLKIEQIVGAYDDREDVVGMYLTHGIPAQVMKIHNKDAFNAPAAALR